MTFNTQSKNRNKIKRDTGRHILNGLTLNIKRRATSKVTHPIIFWKGTENKCQLSLVNRCSHAHTHHTQTQATHLEGKRLIKRFKLQQKVKKNPKRYSSLRSIFWRRQWKTEQSELAVKGSSFNGCLPLTCLIVTKLRIDSVHHHDKENPRGSTPLHLPYRCLPKLRSRVRIWRAGQCPPSPPPPPPISKLITDSVHFWQKNPGGNPYTCLIGLDLGGGFGDGTQPTTNFQEYPRSENRKYFINWTSLDQLR